MAVGDVRHADMASPIRLRAYDMRGKSSYSVRSAADPKEVVTVASVGSSRTRTRPYRPENPVAAVHRGGAALLGLGLLIFGGLGLANQLAYFSTQGSSVLGLSSNGLLSTISVVVGAVLIGAAATGGVVASTVTAVIGGLFLLSGLANLAVLNTDLNFLAFRIENVFFSLVVGMILLTLGLYGRVSGGLADDNPFRVARAHRHGLTDPTEQDLAAQRARMSALTTLALAEQAVGDGRATPEQELLVEQDHRMLLAEARERAWRHTVV